MATTSKKSSFLTTIGFLTLFSLVLLTIASCKNETGKGEWIPTPPDTSSLGKIDHFISLKEMTVFQEQFKADKDSILAKVPGYFIPDGEAFNKEWLLKVLRDPRCVGIRIYYGIKAKTVNGNEFRLMIVGVDEQGKDLYIERGSTLANQAGDEGRGGLEWGQCTPPCSGLP